MKANLLLKHNIQALLKARGQTRRDLAQWCRQTTDKKVDAWISHIFTKPNREIPLKYMDRIADFFGIVTYQLFQPGISPLTERRSARERRTGMDRRVSTATATAHRIRAHTPDLETVTAYERGLLGKIRRLKNRDDLKQVEALIDLALRPVGAPSTGESAERLEATPPRAARVPRNQTRRGASAE